MAQSHDARLAELVAELGGAEVRVLFRDLVEKALQELIDAELTEAIGAAPHERTETRTNQRNGSRSRLLSTPAGDVELRIPKVRVGSFFPSLLEPRRRVDKALWGVIMTPTPPARAPGRSTTWSGRSGASPECRSRRCRGSVPASTKRSRCSAPAASTMSPSPTCTSTPPTSRPGST